MASKRIRSIDVSVSANSPLESDLVGSESVSSDTRLQSESDDPRSVELSEPFVERWTVLVSTTNWEKGAIISAWRNELEAAGAPVAAYSDDAWSRRVGGVTPQHVGRLRRVHQRFGESFRTYRQLYWTHFMCAMDWDDAEMWLEGASQSGWSVSKMRSMRWEANGSDPNSRPDDNQIISASTDEDFAPLAEPVARDKESDEMRDVPQGPRYDEPDFGDESSEFSGRVDDNFSTSDEELLMDESNGDPSLSPFASLPSLPVDVADALEQFKLAIIRHRSNQWTEFSQENMLKTLEALRAFAAR